MTCAPTARTYNSDGEMGSNRDLSPECRSPIGLETRLLTGDVAGPSTVCRLTVGEKRTSRQGSRRYARVPHIPRTPEQG